jgi:hypothetical protein
MRRTLIITAVLISPSFGCYYLKAQEPARPASANELQAAIEQRDRLIQDLARRVAALEKELKALKADEASAGSAGPMEKTALPATAQPERSAPTQEYDKEEQLARAALDRALLSHGSLLLRPGTVEFDNGMAYYNSTSDRLQIDGFTVYPVLIVGDIVSERSERDVVLASSTTRVGLPRDFQLDVRVPYGYQSERAVTAGNTKTSQRFLGLGDVEVGVTKQLRRGRGHGADVLGAFRWKSTSGPDPYDVTSPQPATLGTGFNSLQGSLTAVKTSDPLVFFGSLSYAANLPGTKRIQTTAPNGQSQLTPERLKPGDAIGFQVGTALAVNPEASLNFALDQRFIRSTSLDGKSLAGTYLSVAVFNVGTSFIYGPGRSVDLGVGIGLSRGAPNFQFSVNFPLRFSLIRGPH